jgi:hypothetical protein
LVSLGDYPDAWAAVSALNDANAQKIEAGVLGIVAAYVASIPPRRFLDGPPGTDATREQAETSAAPTSQAVGGISQAQLDALATCESGNVSDPGFVGGYRTGLFGVESGNEGSKSYAEQVADVNRIFAASGAGAWGVLCRGILGG